MNTVERDLLEKPILFVNEDDNVWPYHRGYTISGLPFYNPPMEKNGNEEVQLYEVLFLPILKNDFETNKEDYFFGFRYLFSRDTLSTMSFLENLTEGITHLQIHYEICRVRYFPSGEKTVTVDRTYDPILPTQLITIQLPNAEVGVAFISTMNNLVNFYCNYYVDKKI